MRRPELIKAKSELLADRRRNGRKKAPKKRAKRVSLQERRERILEQAGEFFAEYGLTAQTRALADACGISQRLLYRCFPSKGALIQEVYRRDIAGPFQASWLVSLEDRSRPVEERLTEFYRDYYDAVLTRRWLRLFLYASLAEIDMAPTYIAQVITRMLEVVVDEACAGRGLRPPARRELKHELGWALHGAVSQFLRDTQWGPLDYLIIDMPPGTGDVALTLSQLLPLTGCVVVCTPQEVALLDAVKAISMFRTVNIPILGMVENMSGFLCPDNGKTYDIFGKGGARKAAEELNIPFLGDVPITMSIREHGDAGTTSNNFADPQVAPYLEKICATLVRNLASQRAVAPPMASLPVL